MELGKLIEMGLAGLAMGMGWKALDLGASALKERLNGKVDGNPLVELQAEVREVRRTLARFERIVIDGNGQESMRSQLTRLDAQLSNHVADEGKHTSER